MQTLSLRNWKIKFENAVSQNDIPVKTSKLNEGIASYHLSIIFSEVIRKAVYLNSLSLQIAFPYI